MDEILADTEVDNAATGSPTSDDDYAEDELLVEEISIDGMCGVY
jgi:mycofactocin precursor